MKFGIGIVCRFGLPSSLYTLSSLYIFLQHLLHFWKHIFDNIIKVVTPPFIFFCPPPSPCVLFIYTVSISIICVSQEALSLSHLIDRYMTSTSEWFVKRKDIVENLEFVEYCDISELFIQCNTYNCCEHITGGDNMYLRGCFNLLGSQCAVFVYVWDIKPEYQQKNTC